MIILASRIASLTRINLLARQIPLQVHQVARNASVTDQKPATTGDPTALKDYFIVLPERLDIQPDKMEILKLPRAGQPDIDHSKVDLESLYKGFSYSIRNFENFITDFENDIMSLDKPAGEFFDLIEHYLYPMDSVNQLLSVLSYAQPGKYDQPEMKRLVSSYYESRRLRLENIFKACIEKFINKEYNNLSVQEKRLIGMYALRNDEYKGSDKLNETMIKQLNENLVEYTTRYSLNVDAANQSFTYTVDDPDVLARISTDFDHCQDSHHRERTPLTISANTQHKFMQVCPDRFIRQTLFTNFNRRCSPKGLPKQNNYSNASNIGPDRRKLAEATGYRSHLEMKLKNSMAKTKQRVLDLLGTLRVENQPHIIRRLQELNDFAADNEFEDPNRLGVQEYDVDYWSHRYSHDIIIGKSESELRKLFPLEAVLRGLQNYSSKYLGIDFEMISGKEAKLWSDDTIVMKMARQNKPLGSVILQPESLDHNRLGDVMLGPLRIRNRKLDCLPVMYMATNYKMNQQTKKIFLSMEDIVDLFFVYGHNIQRLLFDYGHYELNLNGCLEIDVVDMLPNMCKYHLLSDNRILKSCSDRGGSKSIDTELASRMLKAFNYIAPFKMSKDLFKSHLDVEVHSSPRDLRQLARDLHILYSPFSRSSENYDYCSMVEIFVGPKDGSYYSTLWSKQLVNLYMRKTFDEAASDISSVSEQNIRSKSEQLIDTLFDPNNFDTDNKLQSLIGCTLEPSKVNLGLL